MTDTRHLAVEALGSEDRLVRAFALEYFAKSHDPDPTLFDPVIAALERYSYLEAFGQENLLPFLAHSPQSVRWFLDRLRRGDESQVVLDRSIDTVLSADPALLEPYANETADGGLPPEASEAISHILDLSRRGPDELWELMTAYLDEKVVGAETVNSNLLRPAQRILRALAPHRDVLSPRIRAHLESMNGCDPTWKDIFVTGAAGIVRDHESTPILLGLYDNADVEFHSDLNASLARIGSPDLIGRIEDLWPNLSWDSQFSIRHVLAATPTEESAKLAMRLADEEWVGQETGNLAEAYYEAALHTLCPIAVEPARAHLLRMPWTFGSWVLLLESLTAVKAILGIPFPERDELVERNRREHDAFRNQFFGAFDSISSLRSTPIPRPEPTFPKDYPYLRTDPSVGRNDPCPCGSGKKFKKCCANKK